MYVKHDLVNILSAEYLGKSNQVSCHQKHMVTLLAWVVLYRQTIYLSISIYIWIYICKQSNQYLSGKVPKDVIEGYKIM